MTYSKLSHYVLTTCVDLAFLRQEQSVIPSTTYWLYLNVIEQLDASVWHKHMLKETNVCVILWWASSFIIRLVLILTFLLFSICAESKLTLKAWSTREYFVWERCKYRMLRTCRDLWDNFVSKLCNQRGSVNMRNINAFKVKTLIWWRVRRNSVRFSTHGVDLILCNRSVVWPEFAAIFLRLEVEINAKLAVTCLTPGVHLASESQGKGVLLATCNLNDFAGQSCNGDWKRLEVSILVSHAPVGFIALAYSSISGCCRHPLLVLWRNFVNLNS